MRIDLSSLQKEFSQTGFAIVPNLFSRNEGQALKVESIEIFGMEHISIRSGVPLMMQL